MASVLVSLAMLMAACGTMAGPDTSAPSPDALPEEHATQDDEELEPAEEPETATDEEAAKTSPEEVAQWRAEAQERRRASPCWVILAGHSYHENSACPELDGSTDLIEMTVGTAIDAGYDPCYYCAS